MAAQDRPASDPLDEEGLIRKGRRFSFFQLVRLLERYYRPAARVGHQGPAAEEVIRFRPDNAMAFPASDVVSVERMAKSGSAPARFRVTTSFLGLYGSTSPLPFFYTEETLRRDPEEDTVRAFVDLFQHRFLSLFYRAWTKYRYYVQFEEEGKDEFSSRMFGLIGLGTGGLVDLTRLPSVRLIRYAGLFVQRPRSASALEGVVSDFFGGVPARVDQCVERWVTIKPEQRISLGRSNCRLGFDASVGERVLGRMGTFRIALGPMGYDDHLSFLPVGESFRMLDALITLFAPDRLDFDVELNVRREEIPPIRLSRSGKVWLGWSSWLYSGKPEGDGARSVVLERPAAYAGAGI
ncbi:MAG TPA: type VI secretion system baseplate subunit TssG [Nitrospiria bacterium]|nr:type VI secretion system baseplate subunit TssG [Nitrospiria bacterium]